MLKKLHLAMDNQSPVWNYSTVMDDDPSKAICTMHKAMTSQGTGH